MLSLTETGVEQVHHSRLVWLAQSDALLACLGEWLLWKSQAWRGGAVLEHSDRALQQSEAESLEVHSLEKMTGNKLKHQSTQKGKEKSVILLEINV